MRRSGWGVVLVAIGMLACAGTSAAQVQPRLTVAPVLTSTNEADTDWFVDVSVVLVPAHDQVVTARFASSDGTATAPADYLPLDESLRFEPGETEKQFRIVIKGDDITELGGERFFVNLTEIAGAPSIGDTRIEVTINDDERLGSFRCHAMPVSGPLVGTPVSVGNRSPRIDACGDDAGEAPALSGLLPSTTPLRVFGASGRTEATPDSVFLTNPSVSDGVWARSSVARLEINLPSVAITADKLEGEATASCDKRSYPYPLDPGVAVVSSSSSVGALRVNDHVIDVDALGLRPLRMPLNIGTLHLNWSEELFTGASTTRRTRALFLDLPGTASDVIAGEAMVSYSGRPCT